jgi:hypothetical protein
MPPAQIKSKLRARTAARTRRADATRRIRWFCWVRGFRDRRYSDAPGCVANFVTALAQSWDAAKIAPGLRAAQWPQCSNAEVLSSQLHEARPAGRRRPCTREVLFLGLFLVLFASAAGSVRLRAAGLTVSVAVAIRSWVAARRLIGTVTLVFRHVASPHVVGSIQKAHGKVQLPCHALSGSAGTTSARRAALAAQWAAARRRASQSDRRRRRSGRG